MKTNWAWFPYGHDFPSKNELLKWISEFDSLYRKINETGYLSDKGLLLIVMKRYEDAIQLYKEIEKLPPNRYSTASNPGTAYELTGNNAEALKWISKSIKLERTSHHGSEWIHVNILESKLKGQGKFTSHHLIGTDFGVNAKPITLYTQVHLNELQRQLYYQLNERLSFVRPKEVIVAQLLFDLGNIIFLQKHYSDALKTYELARGYGFLGH